MSTPIEAQPCGHSRIMFSAASDVDLLRKTKENVGKVIPCRALAKHSKIKGSTARKLSKTVKITVRAKDKHGDNLTTGHDVVTAQCAFNMAAAKNFPTTTITDNDDGTYTISCACSTIVTFNLEVYVNGEKMATVVTTTFDNFVPFFDLNERHPSVTIGDDWRTGSISDKDGLSVIVQFLESLRCVTGSTAGR